ncbi:MAG: antibiotic biosynthesis monooxygenase family protein [Chloroflexota bacterium]
MAAVVLIQRDVRPENQDGVFELLKQLRSRAVLQPGYLSGETVFSPTKRGTHLVISRWRSLEDWRAWQNSPERREILSIVDPLLAGPTVASEYLDTMIPILEGV